MPEWALSELEETEHPTSFVFTNSDPGVLSPGSSFIHESLQKSRRIRIEPVLYDPSIRARDLDPFGHTHLL